MNKPLALIIEDNLKLANIFSLALDSVDFDTEVVTDGQVALTRLDELLPAVVVLDLHLPNISGKDILQYIRSSKRLADTRVILATADALMGEQLRNQADLVLLKPISVPQLRELAQRLQSSAESDAGET